MKTLSIQQPWASLVCAGIKDVENRTWKATQIPGRILIHASSKKVSKNFYDGVSEEMESVISNEILFDNLAPLNELPTSAIIGYVTVTGFEEGQMDSLWADGPGVIKWKIEDAWLFDEPILNVKGKLNLFDYDEIDENNLPPAHQVALNDIVISDDDEKVYIPCEKNTFEKIKKGEYNALELYMTGYMPDLLCIENTFTMKPFKSVTLECGNQYISFEVGEDSGIFHVPDPNDENKPYIISYHFGVDAPWLIANFNFGKKIEEGEYGNE